ncbi:MAG: hypothetical protein RLO51_07530 [Thalassobaculum sp.]|uniref:COG4223 family protein n=1 Tax=Thalassobaculum sp. TaxID=2022740 RepID=UPI0032EEEE1F
MANRPLPNVDPDALSKLASQYPGSGSGRAEPKLGGSGGSGSGSGGSGSGGSGGSGSGGDDGPGDKGPGDKGSGDTGGKGGSVAPAGGRPVASSEPAPAKASAGSGGSRTAAFLTFLFALIALAAAVGALAAPSLRNEARAFLQRYPQVISAEWVEFVTGQDTQRLEVTYQGLDQRVDRLTAALDRILGAPGIDAGAARELLLRTEQNQRVAAAEEQVAAVDGKVGELETRLSALDGIRQSLDDLSTRVGAAEQSLTGLRESVEALEPRLAEAAAGNERTAATVAALSTQVDDAMAEASARVGDLAGRVAEAQAAIGPIAEQAKTITEQRRSMELPLIGMTQLRLALNRDTPFKEELSLAELLIGDDAEALAALSELGQNASAGVTTLPGLRRDFAFVATQMGSSLTRIQSWTQRMSSWLEVLVGTRTMPEADPIGEITAAVASIDAALEAGQLDLALQEAVALNGRRSDVLLEGWIVEARRRLATERAFNALTERIYARIGATR